MGQGSQALAQDMNFTSVDLPPRIRARYLHSRFAWNIFSLIRYSPRPTWVKYTDEDDDNDNDRSSKRRRTQGPPDSGRGGRPAGRRRGRGNGGDSAGTSQRVTRSFTREQRVADNVRHCLEKTSQDPDDLPDISCVNLEYVARAKQLDKRISRSYRAAESSNISPGFSHMIESAYRYRIEHPAATDPGNARVALVSEREELDMWRD
ncbi:hypothetical protein C8R45DRAFT_949137 [Mycena sanguinolenta]|nr:hypothetical protein C8R45DRAFT_949137 [Mycena sanguinolenta]